MTNRYNIFCRACGCMFYPYNEEQPKCPQCGAANRRPAIQGRRRRRRTTQQQTG